MTVEFFTEDGVRMTGSYQEIGPMWATRTRHGGTIHEPKGEKTKCGLPMQGRQGSFPTKVCRRCFRA